MAYVCDRVKVRSKSHQLCLDRVGGRPTDPARVYRPPGFGASIGGKSRPPGVSLFCLRCFDFDRRRYRDEYGGARFRMRVQAIAAVLSMDALTIAAVLGVAMVATSLRANRRPCRGHRDTQLAPASKAAG